MHLKMKRDDVTILDKMLRLALFLLTPLCYLAISSSDVWNNWGRNVTLLFYLSLS